MNLQTPLKEYGKLYKPYVGRLEKLGIKTIDDLLYYFPFRYKNYSIISKITNVQPGEVVTIQGTVLETQNIYARNYKKIQKAKVSDTSGTIEVIWFNQPYLLRVIHKDDKVSLSGKIGLFSKKLVMESPEYEILSGKNETIHTGRLVPIYSETRGVSSKWIRRQIYLLLQEYKQNLIEHLPDSIVANNDFLPLVLAIEQIHFPKSHELAEKARERLSFDELFTLQLSALKRRSQWQENLISDPFSITSFKKQITTFWEKLPFELTNAQKKAVKDIFKDLASKKPMNRLLEGDVGSGKTVVAAIAMYLAHLNGFQSVLMAPTEILAQQHFKTISELLSPLGVKVALATGSIKYLASSMKNKKKKYQILNTDILVGTHAVLSEKIKFNKLGLVVIDEQQRFGVEQRGIIRKKGKNPHLLTMTATPIPRTVALAMYGDLDLSYLDEMPIGRKTVKTWLVSEEKRENGYEWIKKQINDTRSQIFIICPFIEESESMITVKAAQKEYEYLRNEIFKDFKMGLLHGKMKGKEKEEVLTKFRNKEFDILVATPVVEVGIDIPNATIIVIEASERFGLSQLHQLRGRVGRGDKQSYCLLFTQSKSFPTIQRLKAMERMHVGAELAEYDLKLRGPGDVYGTTQHGIPKLKIANFSDFRLIEKARYEAEKIFPKLSDFPALLEKLKSTSSENVTPD